MFSVFLQVCKWVCWKWKMSSILFSFFILSPQEREQEHKIIKLFGVRTKTRSTPAPSVPSRLPFSIPSLSLKQRSIGLPATPPRALTSPPRAPGLAVFATRQYHKICPVLHPPLLVSTHLPNSLDGTTLTLHFSFSFLPSSFLFPIFLLS